MVLSDKTIKKMLEEGTLTITPLQEGQIQPASVDVRLGTTFSVVEDSSSGIISLEKEIRYKTIETDTYVLLPGQLVLAKMDAAAENPYRGKYQGQRGATGSRVYLDK